ncbi:hypothetical protein JCM8097_007509 [Rhodosporidiobolus ruineniae]
MPPLDSTDKQNQMPPSPSSSTAVQSDDDRAPSRRDKGKGKQRAREHSVEDDDDDMHDGTQANGTQSNGAEDEGEEGADEGADEDEGELSEGEKAQRADERKQLKEKRLRQKYRELQSQVEDARGDLANTTVDDLSAQVLASNRLFAKVDRPAEAVLDARVLIATSEAGALKARQLKIDQDAFDTDEFLRRLKTFLGVRGSGGDGGGAGGSRKRRRTQADSDDDDDELDDSQIAAVGSVDKLKWGKVGRVLAGESRRVPPLDFMYGPLATEVKEKKARTQRAKNKLDVAEQVRPEELHVEDVAKNENETGKVTAKIAKILQDVAADDEGIPYLAFVVNPDSFSQTVENMFYFSFLMRENKAAIELDENVDSPNYGDIITFFVDEEVAAQEKAKGGSGTQKVQIVLELTEEVWRDAIETYNITESVIPSRDKFVAPNQSGSKW